MLTYNYPASNSVTAYLATRKAIVCRGCGLFAFPTGEDMVSLRRDWTGQISGIYRSLCRDVQQQRAHLDSVHALVTVSNLVMQLLIQSMHW